MPIKARSTALRREGSKAYRKAGLKTAEEKANFGCFDFEKTATDLLSDAGQTAAAAIRKNL